MAGENCVICLDVFVQPKVLPCGHSCCLECLHGWVKTAENIENDEQIGGACILKQTKEDKREEKGERGAAYQLEQPKDAPEELKCPECRHRFSLPQGGIDSLPNNVSLMRAVRDSVSKCGDCEEQPRVLKCVECNDWLCSACGDLHRKMKATRRHSLVTMEQIQDGTYRKMVDENKPQFLPCQKHKDELQKYYCVQCDMPVCSDCLNVDHINHKRMMIEDKAQKVLENLKKENIERSNQCQYFKTLLSDLQKIEAEEEKYANQAIEDIELRRDEIINAVENRACLLINEVEERSKMNRDLMTKSKQKIMDEIQILEKTKNPDDLKNLRAYEILQCVPVGESFNMHQKITLPRATKHNFKKVKVSCIKGKEIKGRPGSYELLTDADIVKEMFGSISGKICAIM